MRATGEFIHSNPSIATRSIAANRRNSRQNIHQLWQRFIAFLAGSSDPKIQRVGEDNWRVFDPRTNRSLSFTSEQEVRVWLDDRYNF